MCVCVCVCVCVWVGVGVFVCVCMLCTPLIDLYTGWSMGQTKINIIPNQE